MPLLTNDALDINSNHNLSFINFSMRRLINAGCSIRATCDAFLMTRISEFGMRWCIFFESHTGVKVSFSAARIRVGTLIFLSVGSALYSCMLRPRLASNTGSVFEK